MSHREISEGAKRAKQTGRDGNLLAGADQLCGGAERNRLVQSHAHHGVGTFPAPDHDLNIWLFLARQCRDQSSRTLRLRRTVALTPRETHCPQTTQE